MALEKNIINTGKYFCLQNFACLKVVGKDAKVFLQNLIANDIELLEKNNSLSSVITNTLGKVKFLVFIQKTEPEKTEPEKLELGYFLFCEPENIKKLQDHLEFFHIIEEVRFITEKSRELFYLLSTNPENTFPLQALEKQSLEKQANSQLAKEETNNHKPPHYNIFLQARHYLLLQADKDVFIPFLAKHNITQRIASSELEKLRPIFAMSKAGENLDYGEKNLPQECGMHDFISLTKGCFVGQEGIARLHYKGKVMRRLSQIISEKPLMQEDKITNKKQILGRITSVSAISYLGDFYSLGYIKTMFQEKKDALFSTNGIVVKKIIPL